MCGGREGIPILTDTDAQYFIMLFHIGLFSLMFCNLNNIHSHHVFLQQELMSQVSLQFKKRKFNHIQTKLSHVFHEYKNSTSNQVAVAAAFPRPENMEREGEAKEGEEEEGFWQALHQTVTLHSQSSAVSLAQELQGSETEAAPCRR